MRESKRSGFTLHARRNILIALLSAILLTMLCVQTSSAHAILLRSDPAQDAVLHASPSTIHMWFTEALNPTFSTAYVVNTKTNVNAAQNNISTHVDRGDAHVSATDNKEMDLSLKPNLPTGVYAVIYRTQSEDDGHILHDAFLFTIAAANGVVPTFHGQLPTLGASNSAVSGQLDAAGLISLLMVTLVDLCVVFWMGAQLWHLLVLRPAQASQENQTIYRRTMQYFNGHYALPALLVLFFANIGVLVGQALSLTNGQLLQALSPVLLVDLVAQGNFGLFWIVRECLVLPALAIALYTFIIEQRKLQPAAWIVPVQCALALLLLAAVALSGHAAATSANILVYALMSDFLHLLAAAMWVGGMFYIATTYLPTLKHYNLIERTGSLLATLARFSPLAFIGVLLMAISGPINATTHMDSLNQLLDTLYGRALLVKIVCVIAMLAISTIHVFFFRPRLARDYKQYSTEAQEEPHPLTGSGSSGTATLTASAPARPLGTKSIQRQEERLTRTLTWEPVLGVVVLFCTGLLTVFAGTLQPATLTSPSSVYSSQPTAHQALNQTITTTDQLYQIKVQITPDRIGPNTFTATVMNRQGKIIPNTQVGVSFYTTMLDMDMGTQSVNLQPSGKDQFSAPGDLDMGGHWQVRVDVRSLDEVLHHATFDFSTPE
jgi:copper transport protein